ncbi:MAG: aromatic ring-hydroxylating dioxygenase subunit alpha [Alphaproteobacteria bacterium]|nr:aromatic ring-hydroxylating dioxygenase subunit alpha [Alphaproteobacteria bacterium]
MNERTGYGRIARRPQENAELTHVEFGTPMGELLRRYWQPFCLSEELQDLPRNIRILGENLVGFRDGNGRTGLIDRHCAHRGTSMEYAKIEPEGIRCCYHGWLFDVEGRCLEQPAEPPESKSKENVRQAWYPTHEYGGLVFAYMGPPELQPQFPEYDNLVGDDVVLTAYRNISRGTVAECNWLQIQENAMDPIHTAFLHQTISGTQFTHLFGDHGSRKLDFEETPTGMIYIRKSTLSNGAEYTRIAENFVPNARSIPDPYYSEESPDSEQSRLIGWWVPVDNTRTMGFHIERLRVIDGKPVPSVLAQAQEGRASGTQAARRTYEETQRQPDDREAQVSQGPIAIHAMENLVSSDKGVAMFRRRLKEGLESLQKGEDPMGIGRDPSNRTIHVAAGNSMVRN